VTDGNGRGSDTPPAKDLGRAGTVLEPAKAAAGHLVKIEIKIDTG